VRRSSSQTGLRPGL